MAKGKGTARTGGFTTHRSAQGATHGTTAHGAAARGSIDAIASVRRPMRPRGKPVRPALRPRAPFGLNDAAVLLGSAMLLGLSAWAVLAPSPYAALAPIRVDAPVVVASVDPTDERPVGALGEGPGAVADDDTPVRSNTVTPGGAKVIELEGVGTDWVRPAPSSSPASPSVPAGSIVVRDPSDPRQPQRIAHLPDRALIEDTEIGPLPVAASGRRPFDVYAGRWSGRRGNRIALVVGGVGISQTGTAAALESLPPSVTLGFSPQGNSLKRWMQTARREGHEIVLQLPMQAFGRGQPDPRDLELRTDLTRAENATRLRRALSSVTNYVGVMNYTGGSFLADREALYPVLAELRDRGLMLLDDGSSAQSRADAIAGDLGLPFAAADTAIDLGRDAGEIERQLDRLEALARGTGSAIGVASAFPQTIEAIERWIAGVEARGFEIVPVSALARDPAGR